MSGAAKNLKASDVQVFHYITNKLWTVTTASYNSLGIRIFVGQNTTSSLFNTGSDPITTDSASGETRFRRLIYNTVKQLYYTNYISSSFLVNTSSFENFEQNTIYYSSGSTIQNYYNSSLKYFPTGANSIFRVMSIPKNIIGSKIVPKTFQVSGSMYNILDDGEGNLLDQSGSSPITVGNIVYPHGLVIITNPSYSIIFPTASSDSFALSSGQKSGSFNMVFKGDYTIYENEVRCNINEDEFNYSLNPSILNISGSLNDFATGSTFNPYITTVGLYNDNNELLVIGKMSKPLPMPRNSDLSIIIKWDS